MSNLAWFVLALVCFYLLLWWQHKRDWKEDRAIAAWLDPLVLGLWNGIRKVWRDCRRWNQSIGQWDESIRRAKEAEMKERTELETLRKMHGMVRGAEEKAQTPSQIRAELKRLRGLFDMEKEARRMNDGAEAEDN